MHKRIGSKFEVLNILMLASVAAASGVAQVPAGISGTWKVTSSFGNADRHDQIDLVMVLRQDGNEIKGSLGQFVAAVGLTVWKAVQYQDRIRS